MIYYIIYDYENFHNFLGIWIKKLKNATIWNHILVNDISCNKILQFIKFSPKNSIKTSHSTY